jgi:eukaryotic-like serine/threonine-protein kinase
MKKNYTISFSRASFWKLIVPAVIVGGAGSGLCGLLIVDKIVMPHIVHADRGMVTVPSITGLPWESGRQELFNNGLRLQIGSRQYDEKVAKDHIISQQPLPLESVKKGRMVVAVVSKGSEIGVVLNVTNLPERKAVLELKKAGFIIGKVKRDFCNDYAKDAVSSVSPKEGTAISKEMPLDLVVSDGPKPSHTPVPNLIGESLLDAKERMAKSGLRLGKIEYKLNSTVSPGTVLSQSAPPASNMPLESVISIIVSVSK